MRWFSKIVCPVFILAVCSCAALHAQDLSSSTTNEDARNLVNEAVSEIRAENFTSAITKLLKSLQLDPDYKIAKRNLSVAYTNLAWKVYREKNWSDAMPALRKAIDTKKELNENKDDIESLQKCYDYCKRTIKQQQEEKNLIQSLSGESPDYLNDLVPVRFPLDRMPLRVFIHPESSVPGFRSEFVELFQQATRDWERASGGQVRFEQAKDAQHADIDVSWTDKRDTATVSGEAGYTKTYPNQSGLDRSTICLYTVAPTPGKSISDPMMRVACLHELGHALGMQGHSKDPRDIMIPAYHLKSDDTAQSVQLSQRDVKTIRRLYSPDFCMDLSNASSSAAAAALGPRNQAIMVNNEAVRLMANKNYVEAIKRLEAGVKLDESYQTIKENLAVAHFNLALQLVQEKKWTEAKSECQKAMAMRVALGQRKSQQYKSILQCLRIILQELNQEQELKKCDEAIQDTSE